MRDTLQVKGYQTIEAETGEEGVQLAHERRPALVLMDVQLPAMNGIEALRELRADPATRAIPVIAVTASVMAQDRQKIMAAGFSLIAAAPPLCRVEAVSASGLSSGDPKVLRELLLNLWKSVRKPLNRVPIFSCDLAPLLARGNPALIQLTRETQAATARCRMPSRYSQSLLSNKNPFSAVTRAKVARSSPRTFP